MILFSIILLAPIGIYAEYGTRSNHIYDYGDMISATGEIEIESYLKNLDSTTSNEIVIYTLDSFTGHGITKDGIEVQERDMLANFIFNKVPLDGIKGIGKEGKDNGVLVLMALNRDSGSGSIRIEVGKGLEGEITDGTAGEILDAYLVPARTDYEENGNKNFDSAFYNTVIALSNATNGTFTNPNIIESSGYELYILGIIVLIFIVVIVLGTLTTGYGGTYSSGSWSNSGGYGSGGGNFGGGGFGGGGSFGGGAGR